MYILCAYIFFAFGLGVSWIPWPHRPCIYIYIYYEIVQSGTYYIWLPLNYSSLSFIFFNCYVIDYSDLTDSILT